MGRLGAPASSAALGLSGGVLLTASLAAAQQASPSPAPPPALEIVEPGASFGEAYDGAELTHRFAFRNRGAVPVRILEVRVVSPHGRAAAHPPLVPPGGEGYVEVHQPTAGRLGLATFRLALRADDGAPERRLALGGFIQSAYDPDRPAVDFGTVAPGATTSLELFSREVDRLEVRDVRDAPAFLSVEADRRAGIAQEGVVLRLRLRPDAPLGFQSGTLHLRTNVEHQPEVAVGWKANIYEDVVPAESPVDLGIVREGQPFAKSVRLESRTGAAFDVERVDGAGEGLKAEVVPCPEPASGCRILRLRGVGPPASAPMGGTLTIVLKGDPRPLSLPYSGIPVGARTVVKDLGVVAPPAEKTAAPPAEPPASPVPPDPAPVMGRPHERRTRLIWEAQQEQQTYGYLVYRSDRRDGPFRRINPQIVPVSSGPGGHTYTYVDDQVAPGHTYYYYLESVGRGGTKSRLSGVVAKVIPKAPR